MAGEEFSGALSGAAQGAAAGSVAGPIGAAVGGVIGGVTGLVGGKKRKKANKLKKQLAKLTKFVARKELLQQSKLQYAAANNAIVQSGAGTERSSGGFGVLASISSQRNNAIRQDNYAIKRSNKIASLENQANKIEGYIAGASSIVSTAADSFKPLGSNNSVSDSELRADPNYVPYVPKYR